MRSSFTFVVSVVVTVAAVPARAQLSSGASVGAIVQRQTSTWQPGTALRPTVRFDQRWSQLGADGVVIASDGAMRLDRGNISAAIMPAPVGPLRFSASAQSERFEPIAGPARTLSTLESLLSLKMGDGGVWMGAAMEQSHEIDTMPVQPLVRLGGWRRIGGVTFTLSSASHVFRIGGRHASTEQVLLPDSVYTDTSGWQIFTRPYLRNVPAVPSRLTRWSEIELRGAWTSGRAAVDVVAGARRAASPVAAASWARVNASVALSRSLALTAGFGAEPTRIALGIPGTRFARLGLRVAPAALVRPPLPPAVRPSPSAFRVDRAETGSCMIVIRAPRARTVELSGDFNSWKAVSLEQTRPDVWTVTLPLTAGTYRMSLRIDGDKWVAPPGTPTVADEFSGTVGLVVVK